MNHVGDITGLEPANIAGTELLVRSGEKAHTIVLLHGIGSRAASFADLMRAWPVGPRLVAWDMPGYGGSQPLAEHWPRAYHYAKQLSQVRAGLGVDRIHVVGHSLGCLIAGAFGSLCPGEFGKITFLSPALGYRADASQPLPAAQQQRIDDFTRLGAAAFAKARAARLVHDAAKHPEIVAKVAAAMATIAPEPYAQAVRLLAGGDLLASARALMPIACVVSGAEDVITPPDNAAKLFEALRARSGQIGSADIIRMVPDAGHAIYLEQPGLVLRHLTTFFAGDAP